MAVVSIISLLASISAMTFAGPRVYFAMGRDGVFFKQAATIHSRYRTPAVSILAQATWSACLVLTAGADALVNYTGFAIVLFSGVAVLALFVLRAREPNARTAIPRLGLPGGAGDLRHRQRSDPANGLVRQPTMTLYGVIVILVGIPLYWCSGANRLNRRGPASAGPGHLDRLPRAISSGELHGQGRRVASVPR